MELFPASPPPFLFQTSPKPRLNSCHADKGYTTSVYGHIRSAKQRVECIEWNNRQTGRRFAWEVAISLLSQQYPGRLRTEINKLAKRFAEEGFDGHWAREIVKRTNICHYHFLFLDGFQGSCKQLKRRLRRCAKDSKFSKCRIFVRRINNERESWRALRYSLKAKVAGRREDGTWSKDKWAGKRVLFEKGFRLPKVGTFGNFWLKGWNGDPRQSWSESRISRHLLAEKNARIDTALEDPRLAALVLHMHKALGVPLGLARWKVGLDPESPQVREWAEKLYGEANGHRLDLRADGHVVRGRRASPRPAPQRARRRPQIRTLVRALFSSRWPRRSCWAGLALGQCLPVSRLRSVSIPKGGPDEPGGRSLLPRGTIVARGRHRQPTDLAVPLGQSP